MPMRHFSIKDQMTPKLTIIGQREGDDYRKQALKRRF